MQLQDLIEFEFNEKEFPYLSFVFSGDFDDESMVNIKHYVRDDKETILFNKEKEEAEKAISLFEIESFRIKKMRQSKNIISFNLKIPERSPE